MARTVWMTPALVALLLACWCMCEDFEHCSRQCRFAYGFYDRNITGTPEGNVITGKECNCFNLTTPIGVKIKRITQKPWDPNFWCGNFDTDLVCVLNEGSSIGHTTTRAKAAAGNRTVLHCGECAACSNLHDLQVLQRTRDYITTNVTACAAAFAKPKWLGGNRDVAKLRECLMDNGVDFSTDGRSWAEPHGRSTCMDSWTDNVQCDAVQCATEPDCIRKFFQPHNTGDFAGCLKCDEKHCGPEFIKCAGANRRSVGITSDIKRNDSQICTVGYYHSR